MAEIEKSSDSSEKIKNKCLFVKLPSNCTVKQIKALSSDIKKVNLSRFWKKNPHSPFGFLTFDSIEIAEKNLNDLNGKTLNGFPLSFSYARDKSHQENNKSNNNMYNSSEKPFKKSDVSKKPLMEKQANAIQASSVTSKFEKLDLGQCKEKKQPQNQKVGKVWDHQGVHKAYKTATKLCSQGRLNLSKLTDLCGHFPEYEFYRFCQKLLTSQDFMNFDFVYNKYGPDDVEMEFIPGNESLFKDLLSLCKNKSKETLLNIFEDHFDEFLNYATAETLQLLAEKGAKEIHQDDFYCMHDAPILALFKRNDFELNQLRECFKPGNDASVLIDPKEPAIMDFIMERYENGLRHGGRTNSSDIGIFEEAVNILISNGMHIRYDQLYDAIVNQDVPFNIIKRFFLERQFVPALVDIEEDFYGVADDEIDSICESTNRVSLLYVSLFHRRLELSQFLVSHHFLHEWDLQPPANMVELLLKKLSDVKLKADDHSSNEEASVPHSLPDQISVELLQLAKSIYCQPPRLFSLSFGIISKLIGNGKERSDRVGKLGLPATLRRSLEFSSGPLGGGPEELIRVQNGVSLCTDKSQRPGMVSFEESGLTLRDLLNAVGAGSDLDDDSIDMDSLYKGNFDFDGYNDSFDFYYNNFYDDSD